jgi:hypothetical protein
VYTDLIRQANQIILQLKIKAPLVTDEDFSVPAPLWIPVQKQDDDESNEADKEAEAEALPQASEMSIFSGLLHIITNAQQSIQPLHVEHDSFEIVCEFRMKAFPASCTLSLSRVQDHCKPPKSVPFLKLRSEWHNL